jgi:rare lipoprotein A
MLNLLVTFTPDLLHCILALALGSKIAMNQLSMRAAGLVAALWFASNHQAFGECGLGDAFAPKSQAESEPSTAMDISAAHRSLPAGTRVAVRNQKTGRSIIVRITGHSLSALGHVIDLSAGAMQALGMEASAPVCIEVVTYGSKSAGYRKIAVRNPLGAAGSGPRRNRAVISRVTSVGYVAHHRKKVAQMRHAGRGRHPARRSSRRRLAA